jgi:LuxR family maltose regulon positive regulatory protein
LENATAFAAEHGNTTLLALLQAAQADVALRQGDMHAATQWASRFEPVPPLYVMPNLCRPLLTLAKIRLATDAPTARRHAAELLDRLQTQSESTRQTTVLVEVLALQALRHAAQHDETQAVALSARAVTLAQPGDIVRIFVDLGAPMRRLLQTLAVREDEPAFLQRILRAFRRPAPDGGHNGTDGAAAHGLSLPDPLTPRELDVLALLARRLTNGEIAAELGIAPGTVKTHTLNIYAKLAVHDRREAVDRARQLGLIEADIHT